jgi:16S rRNA (guanine527-N7)-methyltransferase
MNDRRAAEALVDVSRETWARIDVFVALLLKWQKAINLVAPSSLPHVWTRHVADSLQLLPQAVDAKRWVDLGSGGGFPGLVIAIALTGRDGAHVDLIESDSRKCSFMREAIRETGAPARVHCARIEAALENWSEPVDVVSSRALAPLPLLLEYAFPLLKKGARGLFLKGQDVEAELTAASKSWSIQAKLKPSLTEPRARLVVVERLDQRH